MNCDELYHLLTIRDPIITRSLDYTLIKHDLIMRIVTIVIKKINNYEEEMPESKIRFSRIKIKELKEMLDLIYSSCLRNISDDNNIGLINIFLFQFTIMFSKHMGIIHEFYQESLNDYFYEIIYGKIDNEGVEYGWMDYEFIKHFLTKTPVFNRLVCISTGVPYTVENLSNPAYNVYGIFFIKWSVFDSDRVIIDYLNKVFYCEIVAHPSYADGRFVSPFEYLYHDISHGVNFLFACGEERSNINFNEIEEFYIYLQTLLKEGIIETPEFRKIKAFIFYELHEGECSLGAHVKSTVIQNKTYSRFFHLHDLKELVPKKMNTEEEIEKYFNDGVELFKEHYSNFQEWKTTQSERVHNVHYEKGGKVRKKRTVKNNQKWLRYSQKYSRPTQRAIKLWGRNSPL